MTEFKDFKAVFWAEADKSDPLNQLVNATVRGWIDGKFFSCRGMVRREHCLNEKEALEAARKDMLREVQLQAVSPEVLGYIEKLPVQVN